MIDHEVLRALEDRVEAVLDGGTKEGLDVLGYGEISTVLRSDGTTGPVAAKRLPPMTPGDLTPYEETLATYLIMLGERGVKPVPSLVHAIGDDPIVPYCIQPLRWPLLVDELRTADEPTVARYAARLVELVTGAVDDRVGLDGQISNWAVEDGDFVYLDVTTPLLRDGTGAERLDTGMFLASLPWLLRGLVRRFLLAEILSHYYDPRAVLLDAIGNLHKERLAHTIPAFLEAANRVVEPAITIKQVNRYYRGDSLMWEVLQRLRRADRWWQRRIRRRRYPFLLPGAVER